MGFGQITFGGLASGLDTNAIISSLVALERRPIQLLQSQRSTQEEKLSLLGTFEGLVKKLQERAQELIGGDFFAHTLTVGTEGIASFTLNEGAQTGSHELSVRSLAAADRYALSSSTAITDPDATGLGTGDITFEYDADPDTPGLESFTVTIGAGLDSLNEIANAINNDPAAGDAVAASVINVGTAATPDYQLVLAGNDTGADYAIQNLTVGAGIDLQNGVGTAITSAANASIVLDGLAIERSTNTFSDVLAGVSFTVSRADAAFPENATTSFTIDSDPEGIKSNLSELVDAYNEVIDFVNKQNEYSEEGGPGGELFGDSALQTMRRTIHSALFDVDIAAVQADTEGYSTLGLVGIDLDTDGRLTIDDSQIEDKIAGNLQAFADLFLFEDKTVGADPDKNGVLVRLDAQLDALLKDSTALDEMGNPILNPVTGDPISVQGLFNRRKVTLNSVITDIGDQIERLEFRIEQFETSLVQRFANLEQVISGLNAQSAYLNSGQSFPSLQGR